MSSVVLDKLESQREPWFELLSQRSLENVLLERSWHICWLGLVWDKQTRRNFLLWNLLPNTKSILLKCTGYLRQAGLWNQASVWRRANISIFPNTIKSSKIQVQDFFPECAIFWHQKYTEEHYRYPRNELPYLVEILTNADDACLAFVSRIDVMLDKRGDRILREYSYKKLNLYMLPSISAWRGIVKACSSTMLEEPPLQREVLGNTWDDSKHIGWKSLLHARCFQERQSNNR